MATTEALETRYLALLARHYWNHPDVEAAGRELLNAKLATEDRFELTDKGLAYLDAHAQTAPPTCERCHQAAPVRHAYEQIGRRLVRRWLCLSCEITASNCIGG